MKRILFLCHGNICRSPMAAAIFRHLVAQAGCAEHYDIQSAALTDEETGHDIYPPAQRLLRERHIPFGTHAAHRLTAAEFEAADRIWVMDDDNLRRLERRFGASPKAAKIMTAVGSSADVEDPWYTGRFDTVFDQLYRACQALLP